MVKGGYYYPAKRKATLSLQFWKDKKGTGQFTVTSNPVKDKLNLFPGLIDSYIFAKELVRCRFIDREELLELCDFFDKVRKELQK